MNDDMEPPREGTNSRREPPPASKSSNIPRVREIIAGAIKDCRRAGLGRTAAELTDGWHLTFRAKPDKVTRARHPSPTVAQCLEVLFLRDTTDWSEAVIGQKTRLNAGRVSEIINGKWRWNVGDADEALATKVV